MRQRPFLIYTVILSLNSTSHTVVWTSFVEKWTSYISKMAVFWVVAPSSQKFARIRLNFLLPDYTALQPRRQPSSHSPSWEPQILPSYISIRLHFLKTSITVHHNSTTLYYTDSLMSHSNMFRPLTGHLQFHQIPSASHKLLYFFAAQVMWGLVTRLPAGRPGFDSRRGRIFSFATMSRSALGLPSLLSNEYRDSDPGNIA
jgi:hypothetical protein